MRLRSLVVAGAIAGTVATSASGAPPSISARAYILVNPATGEVLAKRAASLQLPMASTTKIMTALVTLQRSKLDERAVVPATAVAVGGSTAQLVAGERIAVRNLLVGLMVPSGNDASVALAQHVGKGSQARFVKWMNDEAATLGLTRTRFVTPHGLDRPGHYSTVRDLVRLGEAAMEYPAFREIVKRRAATIPGPNGRGTRRLLTENDLLGLDREVDGIKTGHTSGAGYALVAHATRTSTGVELYAGLIGSRSEMQRAIDAKRLLDWGFASYARLRLLRTGQIVARGTVRDRPGVEVGYAVAAPLVVTTRVGRRFRRTIVAPAELVAPVAAGDRVGEVVVRDGERVVGRSDLVADRDVGEPGILDRVRSGLGRLL